MSRALLYRIEQELSGSGEFKILKDDTGKQGIQTGIKIIAALRVLAYGMDFKEVDELCELSVS